MLEFDSKACSDYLESYRNYERGYKDAEGYYEIQHSDFFSSEEFMWFLGFLGLCVFCFVIGIVIVMISNVR